MEEYQVLVTTHSKLLTLSPDVIKQYTSIIDEDIISTIFKNIIAVSQQTVQAVFYSDKCPETLKGRLKHIMRTANGEYRRFNETIDFKYLSEELEELEVHNNIIEIAAASVFQKRL